MRLRRALSLLLVLALADCGSSPKTNYFTLAPVPPQEPPKAAIASPVTVAAVHVPPSLDRREMVRRTGANSVDVSSQDRWTAPLDEMIRRVLSQDLAARLPKDKVVLPDAPAPPRTEQIVVTIAQFGPDAGGKVALDGSWSLLKDGRDAPALRRDIALATGAATADAAAEAAAMSQLLGQLAGRIADTLAATR
jgi:uncharacterized lipoprotein YmbA